MRTLLGLLLLGLGWLFSLSLSREAAVRNWLPGDWRLRIVAATAVWGALLALVVECVSGFRQLNSTALLFAWLIIDLALFLVVTRLAKARGYQWCHDWRVGLANARQSWKDLPFFAKTCWLAGAIIALFLFTAATTTPTTNWDAHTYHLPRVTHWLQQGSVDHFATDNTRENEFAPWTGFVIAHLFLFGTGDYLVHLPQWSSMILCALLASFMVDSFVKRWNFSQWENFERRSKEAGALAALLVITIPIGMMESMSPQTDLVTAFWLLALTLFCLDFLSMPSAGRAVICGIIFGLGLLTKSTIIMYSAPFMAAGALMFALSKSTMNVKVRLALVFSICVLALNLGHASRNYILFGSPLGSKFVKQLVTNDRISPAVFISNLTRNVILHANCGIPPFTRMANSAVSRFHEWAGMKMDDPATTLLAGPLQLPEKLLVYDDYASAPLHVVWIALALLLLLIQAREKKRLLGYVALVLASAVLFVVTLKFQIYHSRFHLPYLILLLPVAALVLTFQLRRALLWVVPVTVVFYAAICIRVNEARPIFDSSFTALPREAQYLSKQAPDWTPALQNLANEVAASGQQRIGLKLGFNAFEYPFWVMLRNRGADATIKHTFVEDVSRKLESKTPDPTVIITFVRPVSQQTAAIYPYKTTHPPLMALWRNKPGAGSPERIAP